MCGICGIIYKDGRSVDPALVQTMTDVIQHRGPDNAGMHIARSVGFGVRRLSVIDIAGGHQPIHNENKSVWIVYNREIYNFLDLGQALEKKPHRCYISISREWKATAFECGLWYALSGGPGCSLMV